MNRERNLLGTGFLRPQLLHACPIRRDVAHFINAQPVLFPSQAEPARQKTGLNYRTEHFAVQRFLKTKDVFDVSHNPRSLDGQPANQR